MTRLGPFALAHNGNLVNAAERVRCDQGLDHGPGIMAWMHPPVHRLLGWVSRPSALRTSRDVWRLDQCRGFDDQQALSEPE